MKAMPLYETNKKCQINQFIKAQGMVENKKKKLAGNVPLIDI